MTGWRWLGSLMLLAGLTFLVLQRQLPAQGKDDKKGEAQTLTWKAFDGSTSFYQTLFTETKQVMKVNDMEVTQNQKQWFYIQWTPDDKASDKTQWVVTQKIIGVKMEIDIGGNKIAFDSTEANQPQNPMSDFFKPLTQAELKFYINKDDFKVTKIDNVDKFRQKLTETNPQMEALLKNILSEAALKQMAEPTWAAFPPKGVFKAGETWTPKESSLDLGPIGVYTFKNTYTSDKTDPLKIDIKSGLTYKEPSNSTGLPFIIKTGSKLASKKEGTGQAVFDKDKGWFKESNLKMDLEGSLVIDIGGTTTTVAVTQEQTSKVETSADDPVKAIKDKKPK